VDAGTGVNTFSIEQKVREKLKEDGETEEQDLIEEIDQPDEKIENKIDRMKNEGDLYEPEPGTVGLI
jgi:hypothetical protein